jgi:hypothetical protein
MEGEIFAKRSRRGSITSEKCTLKDWEPLVVICGTMGSEICSHGKLLERSRAI